MNTNTILDNYTVSPPYQVQTLNQQFFGFINDLTIRHPLAVLVGRVAIGIFGFFNKSWTCAGLGIALTGLHAYRWRNVITYLAVPLSLRRNITDMTQCVFPERRLIDKDLKVIGSVNYKGLIPKLKMRTSDPYQMGYIQGYLLADTIEKLTEDVLWPMIRFASVSVGDFSGKKLLQQAQQVDIPEKYHTEITGIFEGMQRACRERNTAMKITLDELLLAHKFTDIYKAIGCQNIFGTSYHVFGCTTVAVRDSDCTVVGGRTLDWPAFIKGGTHMILRKHLLADGTYLTNQALPGIIHTHTAFNKHGLVAIINELGTTTCKGIPYGLFTRNIIENAKNVDEARLLIESERSKGIVPASSFHLTVMDSQAKASNFQFYPAGNNEVIERRLGDNVNDTLIITNHGIDRENKDIPGSEADTTSHARMAAVQAVLTKNPEHNLTTVVESLKAANVYDTIAAATFVFNPNSTAIERQFVHGGNFAATNLILNTKL